MMLIRLARLCLLLGSTAVLGCSSDPSAGDANTFPADPYLTLESDRGALTMAVRTAPAQPPGRGSTSVELVIHEGEDARDGLDLEVVPWMPSMAHGTATLKAEPQGDGRYVVHGVDLYMPGRWDLRTRVSGAIDDSATVTFEIP